MDIDVRKFGKVHAVRLKGQLKLGEPVDELRSTLDGIIAENSVSVVLNLTEVPMADSSGVGAMVRYQSSLKQKGGALKLVNPSKLVSQTLKILGLLSVFEVFDDENAAIQSFTPEAATAG
ncbi:MAG: STAS domain-containing protein [Terriglobales bacterium]